MRSLFFHIDASKIRCQSIKTTVLAIFVSMFAGCTDLTETPLIHSLTQEVITKQKNTEYCIDRCLCRFPLICIQLGFNIPIRNYD